MKNTNYLAGDLSLLTADSIFQNSTDSEGNLTITPDHQCSLAQMESATGFADEYNFYTADGSTLFQNTGDEYRNVLGAFDATAFPGITAREDMDRLLF